MKTQARLLELAEDFTYENMSELLESKQITNDNKFILSNGVIHLIKKIKGEEVQLENWQFATKDKVASVRTTISKWIDYIYLVYCHSNRIIIIYKDIVCPLSYYWKADDWFKKSSAFINDYFKNIIDERMEEAIDSIDIDSSAILKIVDKYDLPNSRDLMLVHAIDKYVQEMTILFESIEWKNNKKLFDWVINSFKKFIPKEETKVTKEKVSTTNKINNEDN